MATVPKSQAKQQCNAHPVLKTTKMDQNRGKFDKSDLKSRVSRKGRSRARDPKVTRFFYLNILMTGMDCLARNKGIPVPGVPGGRVNTTPVPNGPSTYLAFLATPPPPPAVTQRSGKGSGPGPGRTGSPRPILCTRGSPLPLAQAPPRLSTGVGVEPAVFRKFRDECFRGPTCNMGFHRIVPHVAAQ